jgi:hypothetical protein
MESCYGEVPFDDGIRSRRIDGVNGLSMHILEAGYQHSGQPLVLLLHGFPELAFSWRKLLPLIAAAGYYVVAPDQRGYGATTGWDARFDGDLGSFRTSNLVRDILALWPCSGANASPLSSVTISVRPWLRSVHCGIPRSSVVLRS